MVHEKNYLKRDLELVVVVFSLQILRHYLCGVHIDLFTNQSLQYEFIYKELNLRQRRWLEFLENYDINVLYDSGTVNVVVDALSRLSMGSMVYVEEEKK